jgi:hypothetical protein
MIQLLQRDELRLEDEVLDARATESPSATERAKRKVHAFVGRLSRESSEVDDIHEYRWIAHAASTWADVLRVQFDELHQVPIAPYAGSAGRSSEDYGEPKPELADLARDVATMNAKFATEVVWWAAESVSMWTDVALRPQLGRPIRLIERLTDAVWRPSDRALNMVSEWLQDVARSEVSVRRLTDDRVKAVLRRVQRPATDSVEKQAQAGAVPSISREGS